MQARAAGSQPATENKHSDMPRMNCLMGRLLGLVWTCTLEIRTGPRRCQSPRRNTHKTLGEHTPPTGPLACEIGSAALDFNHAHASASSPDRCGTPQPAKPRVADCQGDRVR